MAFQYKAGLSSVGSYQISGIPYANTVTASASTSAALSISFPSVTKFLILKNVNPTAASVRIGFSAAGLSGSNYFTLQTNEDVHLDVRVSRLYLISETSSSVIVSVLAGLTGINSSELPDNWSGSAGVG